MKEQIILQTNGGFLDHKFRKSGTVESWQENVARYAVSNSRLVLAVSAAFAAPLIYPSGAESGGFHFRGDSSTGKTTALLVGGSAVGGGDLKGFTHSWRATSNGLEGICAMHCDSLLCLDEISQVDSREVGAIAYMLANGVGKTRASRSGEARRAAEWRILFLSTGELSLAAKIAEDGRGRVVAAGQEVRVIDIPADAGCGLGLFETLHGFPSGSEFSDHLRTASVENYGEPWRAFMRLLVKDFDGIAPTVKGYSREFIAENCPKGADGQVTRVASRFALVAAGGEMATAFGVLPWEPGEATRGAARCFADWLAVRGGVEPGEERAALAAVRRFIEAHGSSRFEAMGSLVPKDNAGWPIEQRTVNRVGFRRKTDSGAIEFIVLPEAWKGEVCVGLDPQMVAKTLAKHRMLVRGSENKLQNFQRLPGFENPARCYVINGDILGDATKAAAATSF